jgi:hypothetical protein
VQLWVVDMLDAAKTAPSAVRARHHAVKRFSAWMASEGKISWDGA